MKARLPLALLLIPVLVLYIGWSERSSTGGREFPEWFQYFVFDWGCWIHWRIVGGSFRGYTSAASGWNNGYVMHTDIEGDSGPPVRLSKGVMAYFKPKAAAHGAIKVYDLGCGRCNYCYSLNTLEGVTCVGIDGSTGIKSMGDNYMQGDLSNFIPLDDADYVMSFEVGEHLPPGTEGIFLKTMMQAKRGIVLSWARPGQGGPGHTNELPQYVVRGIIEPTFAHNATAVAGIRTFLSTEMGAIYHYANMMVFDRQDSQAAFLDGDLLAGDAITQVGLVSLFAIFLFTIVWRRRKRSVKARN